MTLTPQGLFIKRLAVLVDSFGDKYFATIASIADRDLYGSENNQTSLLLVSFPIGEVYECLYLLMLLMKKLYSMLSSPKMK